MIRPVISSDAQQIADIYNYYISNTIVTFEEATIAAEEIASRIQEAESNRLPYLVAEAGDQLVGYAYASNWKGRRAYRYSVEITVYLSADATGRGYGTQLYEVLFKELQHRSYHVALAGIALPNEASVALHESFGMEKVAHLKEVGFKFGNWVDVGYWQANLDA